MKGAINNMENSHATDECLQDASQVKTVCKPVRTARQVHVQRLTCVYE